MRRSRAPSNRPGPFFAARSWAGCTTNMFGFDLRQAQWVKETALPPSQLIVSLQKKGWIEQQFQGPKNEIFYRMTDVGLAALKAPVPIQERDRDVVGLKEQGK